MAVTVDNSVARVSNDGGTSVTTGTFNTAAGDGLVVCLCGDEVLGSAGIVWSTITDNQTPDLTYVEINRRGIADSTTYGAVLNYAVVSAGAITGLTITQALTSPFNGDSPSIKVYKVTGHDTADMVGAIGENTLTTDPQTTTAITSETAGAFFANWTDWNTTGTPTSSDLTVSGFTTTGDISGGSGYKAIGSASSSVTGNINSGGTPSGNWTVFEIRAAAVTAAPQGWQANFPDSIFSPLKMVAF